MSPASSGEVRNGRFLYLPVVPGRLEFARYVRDQILSAKPQAVAVDLPVTLEAVYERAVERLPELSVIIYDDQDTDRAVYETVEPADPFVEALRTAREIGAKTIFLDPDVAERSATPDSYPDTYATERIGIAKYIECHRETIRGNKSDLSVQAEGLAYRLQSIDEEAEVVVVVSLKVLDPLLKAMKQPRVQPLRKVQRKGVRLLNLHPDCLAEVLTEIPFLQSIYEARRNGTPPPLPAPPIETKEVQGFSLIGAPREDPKESAIDRAAQKPLDRQRLHLDLFRATERVYEKNTGEAVTLWQRRLWSRYCRNLAATQRQLLSSLFDLTVAARSVIDDNMAWEMWEMAGAYPAQKIATDLATVKLSGEHMWLDTRRILLRRRLPRKKGSMRPTGLKGRKREKVPGEWRKEWTGFSICSYPPEDLVIENYGLFLKKKGKSILSEERTHTEPFTTSLLDGIDLRETLRNWHEKRIYVRSQQRVTGEVGAIVMIFDEDPDDRYSYCLSWLGEHQNESDMAFYATDPFENIVGPGIGRSEYGGLLLTLPSGRMIDVWNDPDYMFAESKPERLLLAGLDYSLEKFVVYVAAKPPRSIYRSIAAHMGVKIIYIPIGQLSPVALKKVRVMHVLDGHDKREIAKDYVW
ncbi:MAG: hypothetical protein O2968_12595 [Acidobacteria bacterium]|nr:hypothetical protein [Acidobacteriota bacterium]